MRILWVSHLLPYPPKGGVLQRSYNLIRELARHHDVDLLALNQRGLIEPLFTDGYENGLLEAKSALSNICNRFEYLSLPADKHKYSKHLIALKSLLWGNPYSIDWLKSKDFELKISKWCSIYNYDLVHFDTISLHIYKKATHNTPLVLDHHNIESHMMLRRASNEKNILKRLYFTQEGVRLKRYEKNALDFYKGHITCSDVDGKRLQDISSKANYKVIPNGVDIDYFLPQGLKQDSGRLIFVGTMNWYPNIEAVRYMVNKVLPLLTKKRPDIQLDVIGASPPSDLVELANLSNNFNILGFVDDIRPFIEKAAVYVCPIMDGGGTKLKILDALALKKAIVAHPIAAEGIAVENNKNIAFASTPKEYVETIIDLLDHPEKRKKIGDEARKLILDKYSYDSIGKQLSNFYQTLVNR